jgi:hypothetical protein
LLLLFLYYFALLVFSSTHLLGSPMLVSASL